MAHAAGKLRFFGVLEAVTCSGIVEKASNEKVAFITVAHPFGPVDKDSFHKLTDWAWHKCELGQSMRVEDWPARFYEDYHRGVGPMPCKLVWVDWENDLTIFGLDHTHTSTVPDHIEPEDLAIPAESERSQSKLCVAGYLGHFLFSGEAEDKLFGHFADQVSATEKQELEKRNKITARTDELVLWPFSLRNMFEKDFRAVNFGTWTKSGWNIYVSIWHGMAGGPVLQRTRNEDGQLAEKVIALGEYLEP